jgi:hypothetical protein
MAMPMSRLPCQNPIKNEMDFSGNSAPSKNNFSAGSFD